MTGMESSMANLDLAAKIRSIPGFPKPGIVFRDITPLLLDSAARTAAVDELAKRFRAEKPEVVVGIESRGFIVGALVADRLGVGLALVRKKGKLPFTTVSGSYDLEYGTDTIEMHTDAIRPGQRVLVIDDLLATGGTATTTCKLVEKVGGNVVGCGFLIELAFINGRSRLQRRNVQALISYASE
jgi:adenine phosphoribosyltransferase